MKTHMPSTAAACAVLMILAAHPATAQVCPGLAQERWDAGSENGWVGGAGTALTLIPTGGNPNGYIQLENNGQAMAMNEQAPWIGDWGAGGIRELAVHYQLFGSGEVDVPRLRIRRDAASNGWVYWGNATLTVDGKWHSYAAPIDPSWSDAEAEAHGWIEIPGAVEWSWAETVSSVAYLIIIADNATFGEFVGLDNLEIACWAFADGFESGNLTQWSTSVP